LGYIQEENMDKIGVIGLGNMGEAIVKALLRSGLKRESMLCAEIKPDRANQMKALYKVSLSSVEELVKKARYIILAIKPQDSKKILSLMAPLMDENKVIVSIMAGITISSITASINKPVKIIRAMPNICAKIGEGAIGITSNHLVEKKEMEAVTEFMSSMGKTTEVGEELMDPVTALGGSGPAFFLLYLESIIDAGVKMGFTRDKSKAICMQVVKGTLKMLEEEGLHPTVMREMVTSPAGTTIAGLAMLEESAFKGNIMKALEAASKRARELSL
jgi:pyrroline-5-carboxylate reductase